MSALPPIADIGTQSGNVCFVPKADIFRCGRDRRYSITWRRALQREACFPASVLGPVLLSALRRLASICRYEVMGSGFPNWVRCVLLTPRLYSAGDVFSARALER